jgi:uncharacterized membrane protein
MALNLAAVLLFGLNVALRWRSEGHEGPLLLTLLGNVLIAASGWLGGEMVYRHGVGVDAAPPAAPPDRVPGAAAPSRVPRV